MIYSNKRLRSLYFLHKRLQSSPRGDDTDHGLKRSWKRTAILLCLVASIFALVASLLGFYAYQQQILRKHNSKVVVQVAKQSDLEKGDDILGSKDVFSQ